MIVRTLKDTVGTEREVSAATWTSRRLLLGADRMGFSLHDTVIHAGTETPMWYQNHVEAVYCIEGHGQLVDLDRSVTHEIGPGTLYALDQHDRHVLRATTEMRFVCVFNPPLRGDESHDSDGSYPLLNHERDS